jgi:multisubunit Na+/H+ antiporter MnhF subunit
MTFLETLTVVILAIATLLAMLRLIIGPTSADRIVTADTLAMITTISLSGIALWLGNEIYLDVALIYSTLAFVGVVAIARAIEGNRS